MSSRFCTIYFLATLFIGPYSDAAMVVRVDAPAEFENIQTSEKQSVKTGETVTLPSTAAYFVKFQDQLPVFIVPTPATESEIRLKSLPLKEAFSAQYRREINLVLSTFMLDVGEIQALTRERKLDAAWAKLLSLENRYPEVTFLKFIRGSLLFLQGKKEDAIRATEEGLKFHPDHEDGKKFLKEIKGERS